MTAIKLTIAEPCHENWQDMTSTQQGRFCSSCEKNVVDFSSMSDKEVYTTIIKGDANMCGRFSNAQLDGVINYAAEKKMYWHKYFFSFLIPAFLFTKQTSAQVRMGKVDAMRVGQVVATEQPKPVCTGTRMGDFAIATVEKHFELSGCIIDASTKAHIPYAIVQIRSFGNTVSADSSGFFKLAGNSAGSNIVLEISAAGYISKRVEIAVPVDGFKMMNELISLKRELRKMGEFVIASELAGRVGGYRVCVSKRNYIKEFSRRIITTLTDSLKVYPNPIRRGSSFNVTLKLKQTGNYTIQILNAAGGVMFQKQLNATVKKYAEHLWCDDKWNAGVYFIGIINDENKMISASRFVVE